MKSKLIDKVAAMLGWRTIAGGARWIAEMWRAVSPFRPRQGRNETFDEAVRRVGADEPSLAANRLNFAVMAAMHAVASVLGLGFAVAFLFGGRDGGFALVGFAALNASLAFAFAFRHWQIRERRLGSVAEFVRFVLRSLSGR